MRDSTVRLLQTLFVAAPAALLSLLSLAASGCSGDEYAESQVFACPSRTVFTGVDEGGGAALPSVSAYMERRCGTLDCHGGPTIPMRLYSEFGRRHPSEGNLTGDLPTTPLELEANYGAVCAVEPELMAKQVGTAFGATAEELLLVRKARGIEGHKGGAIMKKGDAADQCILQWLRGGEPLTTVSGYCQAAIGAID
jgi:hypothetical protein